MQKSFFLITVLASAITLAASTVALAQSDPAALVKKLVEAIARGDAAGALALLALLVGGGWAGWQIVDSIGAPGPAATGSGSCGSADSVNIQLTFGRLLRGMSPVSCRVI